MTLPALPPTEVDNLREELARVRAQLAQYVNYEPTIADEMTHLSEQSDLLEKVVVQHIRDGLSSGSDTAIALARSLLTELEAAGLDLRHHFGRGKAVTV